MVWTSRSSNTRQAQHDPVDQRFSLSVTFQAFGLALLMQMESGVNATKTVSVDHLRNSHEGWQPMVVRYDTWGISTQMDPQKHWAISYLPTGVGVLNLINILSYVLDWVQIWAKRVLQFESLLQGRQKMTCGQSYKASMIVNYNSRVVIWGIVESGTILES